MGEEEDVDIPPLKLCDSEDDRPDRLMPERVPQLGTKEIFRRLIADEIRAGRLTPEKRRRIIRYAVGMGLNAVEAGELVNQCRREALNDHDAAVRRFALRLVQPEPERANYAWRIGAVVAAAVLVNLILTLVVL